MQSFRRHRGIVALLDLPDVDTDQIIPKQFLKRIERTGFGRYLFYDWRYLNGTDLNPDFEMNAPRYRGASILVTRANFGCGSSREHAPWALLDYGFRCLIAPSFADIFYNNCFKNGLLPIRLSEENVEKLFEHTRHQPDYRLEVDLEEQTLRSDDGLVFPFTVDPFRRHCLLHGLDEIGMTLQQEERIRRYEEDHPENRPRSAAGIGSPRR